MEGSRYESEDLAVVDGVVYKCSENGYVLGIDFQIASMPINYSFIFLFIGYSLLFIDELCGLYSYKPGDSLYWEVAWTRLGACTGTICPTLSPVHVDLTHAGGSPPEFSEQVKYEVGDKVQVDGIVMQCKEWPFGTFCNSIGFEPFGPKHETAWLTLGYW